MGFIPAPNETFDGTYSLESSFFDWFQWSSTKGKGKIQRTKDPETAKSAIDQIFVEKGKLLSTLNPWNKVEFHIWSRSHYVPPVKLPRTSSLCSFVFEPQASSYWPGLTTPFLSSQVRTSPLGSFTEGLNLHSLISLLPKLFFLCPVGVVKFPFKERGINQKKMAKQLGSY